MANQTIAMGIEYQGAAYYGWQSQEPLNLPTVQSALEKAISRVADEPIRVICAGRTDRRVHGSGQVVHFQTLAIRNERAWLFGVNSALPRDIRVSWVRPVDESFHARFSATSRTYHYLLYNHPLRPALSHDQLAWECRLCDVTLMQEGAKVLIGEHDFSAFRGSGCQANSPVRCVRELTLWQDGEIICLKVQANAFLLHMVRNLAGTLIHVGRGMIAPEQVKVILESRDRRQAGKTAPPGGLYLTAVSYPDEFSIPESPLPPLIHALERANPNRR